MNHFNKGQGKYRVSPKEDRTLNGVVFASKAEMMYFRDVIQPLLNAGAIKSVACQRKFHLGCPENKYVADFTVTGLDGSVHTIDIKGMATPKFNHDRLLWSVYGQHPLHIIKCQTRKNKPPKFKTVEIITPGTKLVRKVRKPRKAK